MSLPMLVYHLCIISLELISVILLGIARSSSGLGGAFVDLIYFVDEYFVCCLGVMISAA